MAGQRRQTPLTDNRTGKPSNWLSETVAELDPALIQFRLACRVILSMVVTSLALAALHKFVPFSPAAYALALITAMQGLVAVRDATSAARAITRVWSAIVGFALVGVISVLDHSLMIVNSLLLVVIFFAIYLKKFGPRWQAVGVYAFFCCVLCGYLKPVEGELPGIAVGLLLSSIIAHLIRNYILPEDPARDFHRLVNSLHAMVQRFCDLVQVQAARGKPGNAAVRRAEQGANSAIEQAQSYLPLEDAQANDVLVDLLDLELSMRATALAAEDSAAATGLAARKTEVQRLDQRILQASAALPRDLFTGKTPVKAAGAGGQTILRLAIQVTLASGIALVAGLALSPERWFWAVMTAFIVFTNAQSRGETLMRGLARTAGTALGVVAGIVLATIVAGAMVPTVVLAVAFLFVGFLLMARSYSAFTLCLTIAISLVYGLLGVFTPELMALRLGETLIGCVAGVLVSFSVLPMRTRARLSTVVGVYLDAISAYLAHWDPQAAAGDGTPGSQMRAVKAAEADVMSALAPMLSAWNLGARQKRPRTAAVCVSAMQQWLETVASAFQRTTPDAAQVSLVRDIRKAIDQIQRDGFDLFAARDHERVATLLKSTERFSTDVALRRLLVVLQHISVQPLDVADIA